MFWDDLEIANVLMGRALTTRIENYLNNGDSVIAELPADEDGNRTFVRIRPFIKPGIPREEHRYLNSKYSMWEYWNFEFRRMKLKPGWESHDWDYDLYLIEDSRKTSDNILAFYTIATTWIADLSLLVHNLDSGCPE